MCCDLSLPQRVNISSGQRQHLSSTPAAGRGESVANWPRLAWRCRATRSCPYPQICCLLVAGQGRPGAAVATRGAGRVVWRAACASTQGHPAPRSPPSRFALVSCSTPKASKLSTCHPPPLISIPFLHVVHSSYRRKKISTISRCFSLASCQTNSWRAVHQ